MKEIANETRLDSRLIMAKMPQQLKPLLLLFSLMVAGLLFARYLLVPESFGDYGHYRANSVDEIKELPLAFAGAQACSECHEDIVTKRAESHHRGVACETCHGPAYAHSQAPDEVTPTAPRDRSFCPVCHGYNASRPSGFPQVIADRHNPGKPCMSCHDPHAPTTPEAVKECGACHRDIVNQKSVSAHTDLPCSQCHVVPAEHFTQPRLVLANKPTDNAVCGACHDAAGSSASGTPTVEMKEHSGRYRCWDCHYPHFPEAEI